MKSDGSQPQLDGSVEGHKGSAVLLVVALAVMLGGIGAFLLFRSNQVQLLVQMRFISAKDVVSCDGLSSTISDEIRLVVMGLESDERLGEGVMSSDLVESNGWCVSEALFEVPDLPAYRLALVSDLAPGRSGVTAAIEPARSIGGDGLVVSVDQGDFVLRIPGVAPSASVVPSPD